MTLVIALLVGVACAAAGAALVMQRQAFWPLGSLSVDVESRGPAWLKRLLHARRLNRLRAQLPEALLTLSTSVRAGLSLPQALQAASLQVASPAGEDFHRIVSDVQLGGTLDRALIAWEHRAPLPEVRLLVAGLNMARTTGGNLAPLLDQMAQTLRERERLRTQVRVMTAQGRLSGWVVGCTPIALVGIMALLDREFVRPLWSTGAGQVMLAVAVGLEALGVLAIRAVVRVEP